MLIDKSLLFVNVFHALCGEKRALRYILVVIKVVSAEKQWHGLRQDDTMQMVATAHFIRIFIFLPNQSLLLFISVHICVHIQNVMQRGYTII